MKSERLSVFPSSLSKPALLKKPLRFLGLAGAAMLLLSGCDGGCGMDGFRDAPFPLEHVDKTVPVSAEVRITSHGLGFMSGQVENLIENFQEGGLSFCVPPQDASGARVCHEDSVCDDGSTGCQITLSVDDAALVPVPSNTLNVHITIGSLKEKLPVRAPLVNSSCWLELGSSVDFSQPAQIPVIVPVKFEVDQLSPFRDLRFEIGELDVNIDNVSYRMTGRGSSNLTCGGLGTLAQTLLDGTIRSLLQDEIAKLAEDISREQLCRQCGDGEPACPGNAACDGDGVCMYTAENQCVPRMLGLEGVIEPEALLEDFLAYEAFDIYMTGRVADRGVTDTGLTLGARVGTEPAQYNNCAPVDLTTRPNFAAITPSPSINSDLKPDGTPFMFGMGIHRRTFQHLFWSLWASGALCLEINSEDVDLLTTAAIGALVPSINQLAHQTGPMKILLSPQKAPDIRLGSNRIVGSGSEQRVEEGLLILDWKDLDIHMYGYVLNRYARLFTIRVDLDLPIAVLLDGNDGLLPVLGDVEEAIQNVRILNDEILDADHQRIIDLLPTLLGFALPQLAESLSDPIELPQFFGYQIVVGDGDLRGVDNNQYLGLFANLEYVGDPDSGALLLGDMEIEKVRMEEGRHGLFEVEIDLLTRVEDPRMGAIDPGQVQYAYRLNGGFWHLLGTGDEGRLILRDSRLRLQGTHHLEVRARQMVDGARWVLLPEMEFVVDYEAPTLEIWQDDREVQVRAVDGVDARAALSQRFRIVEGSAQGSWSSWGPVEAIQTRGLSAEESFVIQVEVRDQSGHSTLEEVRVIRQAQEEEEMAEESTGGCGGCASTSGGGGPGALLLLLGVFGLFKVRRKLVKTFGLGLLVLLLGSGCGGCGGEISGSDVCDEECGPNQECVESVCQDIVCSSISDCDLECPLGEAPGCESGICECIAACAGGCGSSEFCCYTSNQCQSYPDWCADESCDPGFQPEITHIGEANSETCEVAGGTCECVRMPPIPLWYHGAYPSLGRSGDLKVISVHNLHYRDLMVGIINDKLDEIEWYFVDGPPRRGIVQGDPEGYRRGIINVGDQVGTHTATAVDGDGTIHVFYRDEDDGLLKYARGVLDGEEWSFETVEVDDEGDTGYYSAVVLKDDVLHLFYTARQEGNLSEIRYRAIDIDTGLSEIGATDVAVLHSGTRVAESREANPRVVGLYLQAIPHEDGIFLSFFDNTSERPGWILYDGETFSAPNFLSLGEVVGPYSSARMDADGNVHVVYMEQYPPALAYQIVGGSREEIATGVRHTLNGTVKAAVGHDAYLSLLADGKVEVLYHDATTHELIRLVRDNTWTRESLDGAGGVQTAAHGLFPTVLDLGDGSRLVVDFAVDTTGEVRKGHPVLRVIQ